MVSVTETVLERVQKALPEMRLCKNVLVIAPMECILRGFMFERTITKGRYYFWRVVIPLYTPLDFFALDSCERLTQLHVTTETVEEVATHIQRIIMDDNLDSLRRIRTLKDFLAYSDASHGTVEIYEGLTHYLLGNVGRCRSLLQETVERLRPSKSKKTYIAELIDFYDELDSNPEAAARRVRVWENASVEKFGLADAMIGARNDHR